MEPRILISSVKYFAHESGKPERNIFEAKTKNQLERNVPAQQMNVAYLLFRGVKGTCHICSHEVYRGDVYLAQLPSFFDMANPTHLYCYYAV